MSTSGTSEDWPQDHDRILLAQVDSTNAEAARRAPDLARPTWIMAQRQTRGRGRRGRAWSDPEGNLAATLVLRPEGPPARVALRSFVAALALGDALGVVTGGRGGVTLKWPNDVLLNGRKLAGILLESAGAGGRLSHLAIGFGVNLSHAPDQVEPGAVAPVSLRGETGIAIDPESFLTVLASCYAAREAQFAAGGFAPIRAAWLARAARLGQEITARTGAAETRGRFETVDEDGNLVLSTATGRRAIAAADVFF
ncbi:biotin--[acetyl-CoA-carboxylase] ligase [Roseovarius spongiae]|uniref:biotin--[biotin carboxyl-carrier protein] ligase n=1 Tax=Roseovarius spongiae TaxID=2320272 RepID=A0A3A8AVB6_9RHOB|nr:biotin--[acetyl-CoA-carboxylase] ligase [Roseovarius spongiae]RKF15017.1 biotin--[acetyl-CoA-carboxylase] ligase [Roseovarius spongiae]